MYNAYRRFIDEAYEAISEFPELQLCILEDSLPYLAGTIHLYDNNNVVYDNYNVRIECRKDYPNSFPYVFETSKRLPHNIDWHVYEDGHFCICTLIEEQISCAKGITLTSFIKEQLTPYLHNQSYREREGFFLNERSHGTIGILESLQMILKEKNIYKIYQLLLYIYKSSPPSRTAMCFCNSKKKYRYCHRDAFKDLKLIGQEHLLNTINYVGNFINSQLPHM